MTTEQVPILGMTLAEFIPVAKRHGMSLFAAQTLYRGFHRRGEVQGGTFPEWISDARRPIKVRHVDGETVKAAEVEDTVEVKLLIL